MPKMNKTSSAKNSTTKVNKANRTRKRSKREVRNGTINVLASFNNTIITVTDTKGDTLVWKSAGTEGFKGSRKSTPFAAQTAAEQAAIFARDEYGLVNVIANVSGPGPGREASLRAFAAAGYKISEINDVTGLPHNGCRPRKKRRG